MPLGLTRNGPIYRIGQWFITLALSQNGAQIGAVVLPQTHVQHAGAGQPDPVAQLAEVMAQRGDKAQTLTGFPDAEIAGGARAAEGRFGQCPARRKLLAHGFQ